MCTSEHRTQGRVEGQNDATPNPAVEPTCAKTWQHKRLGSEAWMLRLKSGVADVHCAMCPNAWLKVKPDDLLARPGFASPVLRKSFVT